MFPYRSIEPRKHPELGSPPTAAPCTAAPPNTSRRPARPRAPELDGFVPAHNALVICVFTETALANDTSEFLPEHSTIIRGPFFGTHAIIKVSPSSYSGSKKQLRRTPPSKYALDVSAVFKRILFAAATLNTRCCASTSAVGDSVNPLLPSSSPLPHKAALVFWRQNRASISFQVCTSAYVCPSRRRWHVSFVGWLLQFITSTRRSSNELLPLCPCVFLTDV